MSDVIEVTIPLDREIKERADTMFNAFGMNIATAINIFIRKSLKDGAPPFDIEDSFFSVENQKRLQESINQYKYGRIIVKTMEELEAMERG